MSCRGFLWESKEREEGGGCFVKVYLFKQCPNMSQGLFPSDGFFLIPIGTLEKEYLTDKEVNACFFPVLIISLF